MVFKIATVATDCPEVDKLYSDAFDKLKLRTEIKPNVVQDFTAIREKYPCNIFAYNLLIDVVSDFDSIDLVSYVTVCTIQNDC